MERKYETLSDYQLGNLKDFDFEKILELIEAIKEGKILKYEDCTKSYVNSLFTPLLSFSIQYLNENEEKECIIGKSTIENIDVLYLALNKNIFDLFFQRKKGNIFYNEEENEKELNSEMLEDIVLLGEKNLDKNETLKEVFNFKKREIISGFKLGYSTQERIINTLKSNSSNNIFELPNVIFYKKNKYNKIFNEIDRVITVDKDTIINNFMVFSKAKFEKNKVPILLNVTKDETLMIEKNSCNFIEVKTSMKYLLNENKQINSDYLKGKTPSEISSIHSSKKSEKKSGIKIFDNICKFIELFKNLNKHFKKINLIIIIDSYFEKTYIKLAEDFVNSIPEQNFDFNLIFVHIESDITYVCELDNYQKIEEEMQKRDKQIEELKKESKLKNLEIEKLTQDSKIKDKKISDLSQKMIAINKKLEDLSRENLEKEIEKKIRKEKFDNYLEKIIMENEKQIKESEYNFIIGKYYNNSFKTLNQLIPSKTLFNYVIDFKTFVRLSYSKENLYMINDIEKKHFDDLNKLVKFNIKNLILLVDFVFILNIVNIMHSYFKDKDLTIKCANNGLNILFLLFFHSRENSNNECSILFNENLLSYESINVNKIKNINNFIDYYYEINESYNENKLDYFPIYDPINDVNRYFLSMRTTNYENEDILVVFCSCFLDFEDISFDLYDNYKYIIILFQSYDFKNNENICDSISKFYFKKEPDFIDYIPDNIKIIFNGESFNLIFFGKSSKNNIAVLDRQTARIQFKFIVKNLSNYKYMIDVNNI